MRVPGGRPHKGGKEKKEPSGRRLPEKQGTQASREEVKNKSKTEQERNEKGHN